jgi:hypothetical protein
MNNNKKELSQVEQDKLIWVLKNRFEKHMNRHQNLKWESIVSKLQNNTDKLWILFLMEHTGGEPDVIQYDTKTDEYIFCDCSVESPPGRRSLCYDRAALDSRKENKPQNTVIDMANELWIELLTEGEYRELQKLGNFDLKTSSWIQTPPEIRKLGWALFCDQRYNQVFTYHNGAESYYAARGFRGLVKI